MEYSLSVFTLNCWGIPLISKDRKARMTAIAEHISSNEYDIVCLQEVWSEKDFFTIKNISKTALPFSHYFYSGVMGSGLCVLSQWRIEDVFFYPWSLNGYVHKIQHGDWFGGKGVAYCRIIYNNLIVNVHIAHLHAKYHDTDIYLAHRVVQGFTMAEFIKLTSRSADISILAGDLNTEPGDLVYRLICNTASMTDPLNTLPNESEFGTCMSVGNSYTAHTPAPSTTGGIRIDHIMFNSEYMIKVEQYSKPLPNRVSGQKYSFSDHDAVVCKLKVSGKKAKQMEPNTQELLKNLKELDAICKNAIIEIDMARKTYFAYSAVLSTLIVFLLPAQLSGFSQSINIFQLIITLFLSYTVFMATLWNCIERNSIKAARASLEKVILSLVHEKITYLNQT